ncbi:hypothetical protein L9F63_007326, partial [Diploptera punctata]
NACRLTITFERDCPILIGPLFVGEIALSLSALCLWDVRNWLKPSFLVLFLGLSNSEKSGEVWGVFVPFQAALAQRMIDLNKCFVQCCFLSS